MEETLCIPCTILYICTSVHWSQSILCICWMLWTHGCKSVFPQVGQYRLDSYLSVIKTSAVHMSTVCLSKVWFSNRRAKWRRETKQRSGTQSECVCFWIRGLETICVTFSFNSRQDELNKNVFLLHRRSKAKRFSSCESSAAARLHISAGTDGSNSLWETL